MSALKVGVCVRRHPEVDYYKKLVGRRSQPPSSVGTVRVHSKNLLDLMTLLPRIRSCWLEEVCIAGDLDLHACVKSNMQILKRLEQPALLFGVQTKMEKVRNLRRL